MKAAVFHGKNDIRVESVKVRKPGINEVAIKVEACGVCGTDLHIYEGAEGAAKCEPPTILGHEFSGVVYETGEGVKTLKPGDRVCVDPNNMCGGCYYCKIGKAHFCENMIGYGTTTHGGFAEFCTVHKKQVYKIGESLSFEEGAMAEPIACCIHGMDLIGVKQGDVVVIIGGGTIGLIMLQLVKLSGASTIIMIEPVESKRKTALKSGADIAINPFTQQVPEVLNSNGIKNADVVIECVGRKETMINAIEYAGKGGTAMLFGLTEPLCTIPFMPFELFKKEVTVKASFINPYTQDRAVSLLKSGRLNVKDLITDIITLDNINKVFGDNYYRSRGKIIIKPTAD